MAIVITCLLRYKGFALPNCIMFSYFGESSCFPRIRLKSESKTSKERRPSVTRGKRKRIISEPMPIVKSSSVVDKLLSFNGNNNVPLLSDVGSFSESPCHRGFNPLYISETSSTVTEYQNIDEGSVDEAVFVTPVEEEARRNSVCAVIPPKPPRMRQKRTFICQNRGCGNAEILLGRIQVAFKSCNFCFTHYCSAKCQNENLREHMKICFYGKIDSNLTKLSTILRKGDINAHLSKMAYDGYMERGRGCLFMVFSSKEELNKLVDSETMVKKLQPLYSTVADVKRGCVKNKYQQKLLKKTSSYEPSMQFIVNIAIVVGRRVPNNPVPRTRDVTVRKIVLLDLHEDIGPKQQRLLLVKECLPPLNTTLENSKEYRRKSI